eukprot:gene16869-20058_t
MMLKSYTYNSKNTAKIVAYGNVTLLPVDDLYRPSSTVSLGMTWNRMHLFNLTDYSRLVYIDAASSVMDNLDPLFDLVALDSPSIIVAGVADYIWDFNTLEAVKFMWTQLMVVKPNTTVFETIMASRTNPDDSIYAIYPKSVAFLDDFQYNPRWYNIDNNAQWNSLKVLLYKDLPWSYVPTSYSSTYTLQSWFSWFTESKIYCNLCLQSSGEAVTLVPFSPNNDSFIWDKDSLNFMINRKTGLCLTMDFTINKLKSVPCSPSVITVYAFSGSSSPSNYFFQIGTFSSSQFKCVHITAVGSSFDYTLANSLSLTDLSGARPQLFFNGLNPGAESMITSGQVIPQGGCLCSQKRFLCFSGSDSKLRVFDGLQVTPFWTSSNPIVDAMGHTQQLAMESDGNLCIRVSAVYNVPGWCFSTQGLGGYKLVVDPRWTIGIFDNQNRFVWGKIPQGLTGSNMIRGTYIPLDGRTNGTLMIENQFITNGQQYLVFRSGTGLTLYDRNHMDATSKILWRSASVNTSIISTTNWSMRLKKSTLVPVDPMINYEEAIAFGDLSNGWSGIYSYIPVAAGSSGAAYLSIPGLGDDVIVNGTNGNWGFVVLSNQSKVIGGVFARQHLLPWANNVKKPNFFSSVVGNLYLNARVNTAGYVILSQDVNAVTYYYPADEPTRTSTYSGYCLELVPMSQAKFKIVL